MRLVTFSTAHRAPAPGVALADGSVLDVAAVLAHGEYPTVARLMGADGGVFEKIAAAESMDPDRLTFDGLRVADPSIRLHNPLGERVFMVCAGANYGTHVLEMGEQPSEDLTWFVKNPNSVIGTGEAIVLPSRAPAMVDFEGELCVVFGRSCHDVASADAMSYVGGYTIMNDVSARDALAGLGAAGTPEQGRSAWMNMLLGKQFPTFSPLGPAVVTADEIGDPGALRLTTKVNGRVMQDANTSDLLIGIADLVSRLSQYFVFAPGDVLSTGTPSGCGVGQQPPVYLSPGDTVDIEVDGIGTLSNGVVAAPGTE